MPELAPFTRASTRYLAHRMSFQLPTTYLGSLPRKVMPRDIINYYPSFHLVLASLLPNQRPAYFHRLRDNCTLGLIWESAALSSLPEERPEARGPAIGCDELGTWLVVCGSSGMKNHGGRDGPSLHTGTSILAPMKSPLHPPVILSSLQCPSRRLSSATQDKGPSLGSQHAPAPSSEPSVFDPSCQTRLTFTSSLPPSWESSMVQPRDGSARFWLQVCERACDANKIFCWFLKYLSLCCYISHSISSDLRLPPLQA